MALKFSEFDVAHGCCPNYIKSFCFDLQPHAIVEDNIRKANLSAECGSEFYDSIVFLVTPYK